MCQNAKTFWFGTAYFDGIWASKSKFQGKHHPLLVKSSSSFHSSLMGPTRCQKGLPTNSCPPSTHPPALVVGALFGNSWNPSWWVTKNCYFPLDKGNSYSRKLFLVSWQFSRLHIRGTKNLTDISHARKEERERERKREREREEE